MTPSSRLSAAMARYIAEHADKALSYVWKVTEPTWAALATGFDHKQYAGDLPQQNIELKRHLAGHWAVASLDEKIRIATWIVRDWGGIRRNSPMTILGYVNQADAERPATPFFGISSYSKILGIKDPERYAVYDARVAASLNAVQLLIGPDELQSHLRAFFGPPGRNETVKRFDTTFSAAQAELGFVAINRDQTYGTYMTLLPAIAAELGKSVLEVEMFLFGQANQLCEEALPLATAMAVRERRAAGI
jgi:hypothetical protein